MNGTKHMATIVALSALVVGCSSPNPQPTMGTHTDDRGRFATRGSSQAPFDSTAPGGIRAAGSENTATAAAVRERLIQEGTVEPARVRVQDDRGNIYLSGTVDSASQRMRAEQVANGTPGVNQVFNQLQIAGAAGTAPLGTPGAFDDRRAYDERRAAGGGSCTLVGKIPAVRSDPAFSAVQVRVYEDLASPANAPAPAADTRTTRLREERTIQQGDRVVEERRTVEERPGFAADPYRDNRGNIIWTGWLRQGDRVNINSPRGPIRYDYRYSADDKFHDDKSLWCNNGALVAVP